MRVELEPWSDPNDTRESYRVLAVEDAGLPKTLQIGTVTRLLGSSWLFLLKPEGSDGKALEVMMSAGTLDELRAAIRDRFGLLDLAADRLSDETMSDVSREMLRALSSLATTTHTVAGFTSALVYNIALVGAVDIKPEGREVFVEKVIAKLREELAAIIATNESRSMLKGAVREMLDKLMRPEGGSNGPTTH